MGGAAAVTRLATRTGDRTECRTARNTAVHRRSLATEMCTRSGIARRVASSVALVVTVLNDDTSGRRSETPQNRAVRRRDARGLSPTVQRQVLLDPRAQPAPPRLNSTL